jgi:hypothetical protein
MIVNSRSVKRGGRAALAALVAAPPVICFAFVLTYGVDVPFWDQWDLIPHLQAWRAGRLGFDGLTQLHNEHRIFFPRAAMLAMASITRYDVRAEMILGWVLLCCSAALIMWRQRAHGEPGSWLSFLPVSFLMFSLRQWENLLWGWQIVVFFCICGFLVSVYALERAHQSAAALALAIGAAWISSFSFGAGLAVWPIGLATLIWQRRFSPMPARSSFAVNTATWIGSAILAFAAYFYGYAHPGHHPDTTYFVSHPKQALCVLAGTLGGFASDDSRVATAFGLVAAAALALVLALAAGGALDPDKLIPVLPLIGFWLATALMVTVARAGFGPDAGLASRYATLTTLGAVGLYQAMCAIRPDRLRRIARCTAGTALVVAALNPTAQSIRVGSQLRASRAEAAQALRNVDTAPDDLLRRLWDDPSKVRDRARWLRANRLSVFRDGPHELDRLIE